MSDNCSNWLCQRRLADRDVKIRALEKQLEYMEKQNDTMSTALKKQLPAQLEEMVDLLCDMSIISRTERLNYERNFESFRSSLCVRQASEAQPV